MTPQTMTTEPLLAATHCLRCEGRIKERWDPTRPICANCALEAELFDRDSRLEPSGR